MMTAGDLKHASAWTQEVVETIAWRQNRHQGVPRWVVTTLFDWEALLWKVGFREEGANLKTTVWLTIRDEYGSSPAYMPDLRFDDLVDAIRDHWEGGGELNLDDFLAVETVRADHFLVEGAFQITQGPAGRAVSSAGTHDAIQPPRRPKVGDVITMDGQQMRVISVSPSGVDVTLAPIENTVDPELLERERAIREAQEREAHEIMLEALRRTGS